MAKVFLSYVRDDAAKAQAIALALEKAGHSVWWDRHIKGGAQFSDEIEQALTQAEAVVVLWSAKSVRSAWVRDEAAAGRDSGRLVPVLIDGTEAPLGFRQYQSIAGSSLNSRGGPKAYQPLLEAIGALAGPALAPAAAGIRDHAPAPWRLPTARGPWIAVLAVILAGAALLLWQPWRKAGSPPVVAVRAAEPTAASSQMARDLMIKLGSLQKARANYLSLTETERGADLILEAGSTGGAGQTEASVALLAGKDRSLLWSQQFTQDSSAHDNLRHQVAITTARVLDCAVEAMRDKRSGVGQAVLKLYLNGCATFDELAYGELRPMIPIMREVTRQAPRFQGAWGKLIQAEILTGIAGPGDVSLHDQLRRDVAAARRVNPHHPEAYLGEIELLAPDAYGERLRLLDAAIEHNPEHADTYAARAHYLRIVGRMSDAVASTQRAAELNPLSPALRNDHIAALTFAGQFDRARQELAHAEQLWPGSSVVADARFRFNMRYGDPRKAQLDQQRGSTMWTPRLTEAFLAARIAPTPANVETAIGEAEALTRKDPRALPTLIQVLGTFDRDQEIAALLLKRPRAQLASELGEILFRPPFRELWRDPRSMALARHLKLTGYWRQSGKWPDFCFEPDLPYDCKAEAAKLG